MRRNHKNHFVRADFLWLPFNVEISGCCYQFFNFLGNVEPKNTVNKWQPPKYKDKKTSAEITTENKQRLT